jgi:uncharacterized FAD-dependent dehydrogenase
MTVLIRELKVPISESQEPGDLLAHLSKALGRTIDEAAGSKLSVHKRSLDARKKSNIHYVYQLRLDSPDEQSVMAAADRAGIAAEILSVDKSVHPVWGLGGRPGLAGVPSKRDLRHPPVIIGTGPAGVFSGLVLAEAGIPCVLVDRGEAVEQRMRTVGKFLRNSAFTPESNYCFGEGGAGTFSDGKLTCGRNHPLIRYLFERWVEFGAPDSILWEAHPHIGTDYLMRIAIRMRNHIRDLGSRFVFGTRLEDIESGGSTARFRLRFSDGSIIPTDHVVLAIGHSARDTYEMLLRKGVAIAPKPFALGARIEHPQEVINEIQYGKAPLSGAAAGAAGSSCALLPAAEYKLAAQAASRGIWTFCMCPGGYLLPTSAQPGHLAINGMSYHSRASGFANAAVVVNIAREDFFRGHPLDGMKFQSELEQAAFIAGGGNYFSPAQRLTDFIKQRPSRGELKSTYRPGVSPARLDKLLPDFVSESLRIALAQYNDKMRGYISSDAIIAGVESKTSSPIVMMRDEHLQSISHPGLFPTGEGAGFAGGIVSAALDGVKVARAVLESVSEMPTSRTIH